MSDDSPPRPDAFWPSDVPPERQPGHPAASWRWWEALLVYLGGLLLAGFLTLPLLAAISTRNTARFVSSILAAVAVVGVLLWWLHRYHPGWRAVIGFPHRSGPEVGAGVAFGLILYPIAVFGIGLVLNLALEGISGKAVRAPRQVPPSLDGLQVALVTVYALIVAPIHEELFFRGCLFRPLRDRFGFAAGAVGSGVAFGLIHYIPGPWQSSLLLMGVMTFTGAGLAYLYERRGNIVATVAAHATFNVVGLTLIFALS